MALEADSEKPELGAPQDYEHNHPGDHTTDWGWHGEWGRGARITGWLVIVVLLVMMTATHYNLSGTLWLGMFAAALFVILVWDIQRRRNAWRRK